MPFSNGGRCRQGRFSACFPTGSFADRRAHRAPRWIAVMITMLVSATPVRAAGAFKITALSDDAPTGFAAAFDRQVDVFGVRIYATPPVPRGKLLHVANVLAQYLDNDADGAVDNKRVLRKLLAARASMVMFADSRETEAFFEAVDDETLDAIELQDVAAAETYPGGAAKGRFDASLEEVLHLISHVGLARAYPRIWGERAGTKLAKAMDIARGGHLLQIPEQYSDSAWYTYDDVTCDYSCQATEYFYWGLTSLLGLQDFPGRFDQIRHEWRLNTPEKLATTDARLYRLLIRKRYRLPTIAPDGDYRIC